MMDVGKDFQITYKREQSAIQAKGSANDGKNLFLQQSAAGKYWFIERIKDEPSKDGYSPAEDRIPNGCSM